MCVCTWCGECACGVCVLVMICLSGTTHMFIMYVNCSSLREHSPCDQ